MTISGMSLRRAHYIRLLTLSLAAVFVAAGVSLSRADPAPAVAAYQNTPVSFTAKSLAHDDDHQTVTAIGDVELVQGMQILRADKMVYYLAEDRVTAIGNVSLLDERGDVHFAEYVELHNHMKD